MLWMLLVLGVVWVVIIPAGVIACATRRAVARERRSPNAALPVSCGQPRRVIRAKQLRRCSPWAGRPSCGLRGPRSLAGTRFAARSHARGLAWPRRHR